MQPKIDPLPNTWQALAEQVAFINARLMTTGSEFVLQHWDCKYMNLRVDMRMGFSIMSPGNALLIDGRPHQYFNEEAVNQWVMDSIDAARYRWLRDGNAYAPEESHIRGGNELDSLCDTKGECYPHTGKPLGSKP